MYVHGRGDSFYAWWVPGGAPGLPVSALIAIIVAPMPCFIILSKNDGCCADLNNGELVISIKWISPFNGQTSCNSYQDANLASLDGLCWVASLVRKPNCWAETEIQVKFSFHNTRVSQVIFTGQTDLASNCFTRFTQYSWWMIFNYLYHFHIILMCRY